jgi:hypothetical protein
MGAFRILLVDQFSTFRKYGKLTFYRNCHYSLPGI